MTDVAEGAVDHLFPPFPVPEDLARKAADAGWPEGVLELAINMQLPRQQLEMWLSAPKEQGPQVAAAVAQSLQVPALLNLGTLQGRAVNYKDTDAFARLWDNSHEEIGEWDVWVQRSPNPFAQYRLQRNVEVLVVVDRGVMIASMSWATSNRIVAGQPIYCGFAGSLRVDDRFQRRNYGRLARNLPRSPLSNQIAAQFVYIRGLNHGVIQALSRSNPAKWAATAEAKPELVGIPVSVQQYEPVECDPPEGLREATVDDLDACAEIIDRTHRPFDLYEPVNRWNLQDRLDEGRQGPARSGWLRIYNWRHFRVIERDGQVVACGGLWDRGKHIRERWRHRETGEERVIETTNVLDWGFAEGHDVAMAELLRWFGAETGRRGRSLMVVPLEPFPALRELLGDLACTTETRGLDWSVLDDESNARRSDLEPHVTAPVFTDLRYW